MVLHSNPSLVWCCFLILGGVAIPSPLLGGVAASLPLGGAAVHLF